MIFICGFWNRDDSRLSKKPGKGNLCWRGPAILRGLLQHRVFKQAAAVPDRRIGHNWNAVFAAPGQQLGFNRPLLEIVENLVGGTVSILEFLHIIDIKVRHAPAPNLLLLAQFLSRFLVLDDRALRDAVRWGKLVRNPAADGSGHVSILRGMARKIPSLGRFLGVRALYAMAYGEISSSLYYALGITAVYALSLTPVVFAAAGFLFALAAAAYAEGGATIPEPGGASGT